MSTQEYYVILDASGNVVHEGPLSGDGLRSQVTELAGKG